ncbi:MAG: AfsR/SARP family transcriptional regulator [Pseudonocardia sp.]
MSHIEARLLGPFTLHVDGVAVTGWRGRRGVSVLRYLLARRGHRCRRDELLEEFWPGVPAVVARNRLQVALSGARRALAPYTRANVVEYAGEAYGIDPALDVHVDVERFDALLRDAALAERNADPGAALAALTEAVATYRGDFAVDAPDEDWAVLPRESLRLALLDVLDRTARLQRERGDLAGCIGTARRMLEADPGHEDAHRLLMRCFAEQGRPHLAVRQFEFCRRVLRASLGVEPATETVRLLHAVREPAGAGGGPAPAVAGRQG